MDRTRSIAVGNKASEAHRVISRVRQLGVFLRIYNGTFRVFALMMEIYFITVIVTYVAVAVKLRQPREIIMAPISCSVYMALLKKWLESMRALRTCTDFLREYKRMHPSSATREPTELCGSKWGKSAMQIWPCVSRFCP